MYRKLSLVLFVALVLGAAGSALACDWTVSDEQNWDELPTEDGGQLCIVAGGYLRVHERSTIQEGGEVVVYPGGKLDYYPNRLNMNDGTITMLGGEANFDCEDGIKVGDDYGPSNINILGGVMWARGIEGRFERDDGLCRIGGGILRISEIGSGPWDPHNWLNDGRMIPADGYAEVIITPWNDGVEITARPACVDVPNVVGMQEGDAEAAITGAGLAVGTKDSQHSDTAPAGEVIGQSPAAGECVNMGTPVNLVISLGAPSVPDVSGMSPEEACAAIAAVDELVCGETLTDCWDVGEEPVPAGTVMGTDPPAGTEVPIGSSINIVVSTGQCAYPVDIDIKPGSCPNPFNLKSMGVTPAAILGSEELDVTTIDPASIRLDGVPALRSGLEDVATPAMGNECACSTEGADGYMDMTVKFKSPLLTAEIADDAAPGAVLELTLTAYLEDGTLVEGTDCIVLVGNVPKVIDAMRADLNGDGKVNGKDLLILKAAWYMEY
jgi:hypothetical protein